LLVLEYVRFVIQYLTTHLHFPSAASVEFFASSLLSCGRLSVSEADHGRFPDLETRFLALGFS